MTLLLYIALGYLAITTAILLLNRKDFRPLLPAHKNIYEQEVPLVSICIPARNEEAVIERCVRSALRQNYPNLEVLVLDDESTDRTADILQHIKGETSIPLVLPNSKPKPHNWLGKPWACQQLADHARGNILLFIDADTWLEKNMVAKVVRTMGHDVIDFLTVWPQQQLNSFWEKTILPLVYYALLTLLPSRFVHKAPKWIPKILEPLVRPMFAAACGQCMAFKRSAYESINGHFSVKDQVVEDVALARRIKKAGLSMKMYHGQSSISCRMYTSAQEIRDGFSKNFLAGFDHNIPLFAMMALLHLVVFVLPFILLPIALLKGYWLVALLSGLAVVFVISHRLLLAAWFNWSYLYSFLHPLGVLWFQKLGLASVVSYYRGESSTWKGRKVG